MQSDVATHARVGGVQFSLAALFEYMTVSAVPLAFVRIVGLASSMLLMAMGLMLAFRQGALTLALFMSAVIAAEVQFNQTDSSGSLWRQVVVAVLVATLCAWYATRRRATGSASPI